MAPLPSPPDFSLSLCHPQSNWAPLVLAPEWVGLCTPQAPMGPSNDLSCEAGVSPAATPTPTGVFNQSFEALFPCAGALGCAVCFAPRPLSGLCVRANVGPRGATRRSTCPVLCHSESSPLGLSVRECGAAGSASGQTTCPVCPTLRQSRSRQGHVSPLHPVCPSPPLLPVWMKVYFLFPWCRTSLPFDFLSVLVVGGGTVCLPTPPTWFSRLWVLYTCSLMTLSLFSHYHPSPLWLLSVLNFNVSGCILLAFLFC